MKNGGIIKITVGKRRYKAGYIVKSEYWRMISDPGCSPVPIKTAYNLRGEYIGDPLLAKHLVVNLGIKPTRIDKTRCICSIGYCKRQKKWYGWSHRARVGFGIGDRIFEEDYKSHLPENKRNIISYLKHGRVTIENMKQAKQSAINFANYIS